jgi:hypothetical protein
MSWFSTSVRLLPVLRAPSPALAHRSSGARNPCLGVLGKAAELLRAYLRRRAQDEPVMAEVDPDSTPEAVLQLILSGLDEIRAAEGLTADQKRSLEKSLIRAAMQHVGTQIDQIRTTLVIAREKSRQGT